MTIIIAPFRVDSVPNLKPPPSNHTNEEEIQKNNHPIIYWGIYLDDKQVSYVSSEELAEKLRCGWKNGYVTNFKI
jgi:hypothetical protein